jgi:hypothetical protein
MLEAKKEGIIESVGLVRQSNKYTRGATTIWQSRIFKGGTCKAPDGQVGKDNRVAGCRDATGLQAVTLAPLSTYINRHSTLL